MQEKHVVALIAAELRVPAERITLDADLVEDLGADSLSLAVIVGRVEDELGAAIPAETLQYLFTVQDLMFAINADQLKRCE